MRDGAPVLAATEKVTNPLPVPLPPEVILIQLALLAAVQEHPAGAVTETMLLVAPLAGKESCVGEIV